jgi:FMN phosphatase YigB (HAD superfamily)
VKLKVIFIDWDGTLSGSRFWEHWLDEDPDSYNKIQQDLFIGNGGMVQDWMRGYIAAEQVVSEVAQRTGLDYQYLLHGLEESCKSMVLTHSNILDLIKAKRDQGLKVVVATDNMDTFHRWTVPAMKLEHHFDGILTSVEAGALKEDMAEDGSSLFFHHYLNQNAIEPGQSLLIDDRDMGQVASKLGMNFTQVTPSFNLSDALRSL